MHAPRPQNTMHAGPLHALAGHLQLHEPVAPLFGALPGAGTCQFGNRNDTGSRYSFTVSCGGPIPMSGNGSVNYSAQSMNGELVLGATLPLDRHMSLEPYVARQSDFYPTLSDVNALGLVAILTF